MKRIILILSLLVCAFTMKAQTISGERVTAKTALFVKDWWITDIQRDTSMTLDAKLPTSKAVKDLLNGRSAYLASLRDTIGYLYPLQASGTNNARIAQGFMDSLARIYNANLFGPSLYGATSYSEQLHTPYITDILEIGTWDTGTISLLHLRNNFSEVSTLSGVSIDMDGYWKHARIATYGNPQATQGGYVRIQTYSDNTTLNEGIYIGRTGKIGLNTITEVPSAIVNVESTTAGFLFPRMTTIQRNAISSPAEGLVVYDLTTHSMWYWNATDWIEM